MTARFILIFTALFGALSAQAGTISLTSTYQLQLLSVPASVLHAPGTYITGGGSSLTASPTPSMTLTGDVPISSRDSVGGWIEYQFEFAYIGSAAADATIPVSFHTVLDADAGVSGGIASGDLGVDGNVLASVLCNYGFTCGGTHVDQTFTLDLAPDVVHTVRLDMSATSAFGRGFSHVSVDPQIFVDPGFSNAANYSLQLPPGVGNSLTSTPEPSTWGLMVGAAAVFFVKRRVWCYRACR